MEYSRPGLTLVVRHTGQEIPLAQTPLTIGRQAGNALVLADTQVSRHHAVISIDQGMYVLQDLNSANGTYVNGRRVTGSQVLRDGDVIRVGDTILEAHLAAGGSGPTVVGSAIGPGTGGRSTSLPLIAGLLVAGIVVVLIAILVLWRLLAGAREQPVVTILSPVEGTQIAVGSQVALQASATGARDITRLDLAIDDAVVATTTSPDPDGTASLSLSQPWTFGQVGTHTVSARAYTARGDEGDPASVSLVVVDSLAQLTPSPGATETAPAASATPEPPTAEPPTAEPPTAQPPTWTPSATPSSTPTHTPTWTPTDTPTPTPTPTWTPTPTPTPEPVVSFWADATNIAPGGSTILHWHVENVSAVYLNGAPVTGPDGQQTVSPAATTTYHLRAVHAAGEVIREITITVTPTAQTWTHPVRVLDNRTIYHLRLTGPGEIRASATWTGTQGELALIVNGPGQVGAYAREDGPTGTEVVYNVTAADYASGSDWLVTVASFGSGEASGTITIRWPSGSAVMPALEAQFAVEPGYGSATSLIVLRGPGAINALSTWTGSPAAMAVIINGPGQVGYYARQDGGSPLSVGYTVTPGDFSHGDVWRVSLTSFTAPNAEGSITLTFP